MANLAQTVNVLQALILTRGRQILLTPTYHVFELYKVHQDAKYLPVKFTSPDYMLGDQKIPALNLSASRDSLGTVHITMVNLDPNKTISIKTSLNGLQWKTINGQIVTAANLTDINTFDNPDKVQVVKFSGMRKEGNDLAVDLPAKSIVMLELK